MNNTKLILTFTAFTFIMTGCNPGGGGNLFSSADQSSLGGVVKDNSTPKPTPIVDPPKPTPTTTGNPTPQPTTTATSNPTPTATQGGGNSTGKAFPASCVGENGVLCNGGFDFDPNHKKIPSKIIFLGSGPASNPSISAAEQASMAASIINTANTNLVKGAHKFIQFDAAEYSYSVSPALSTVRNDSNYMIQNYGSTGHYVLVLVKGFLPANAGGTIGYSPGLRIDWKSKQSIVVMDYDYVKNNSNGPIVIVHELFHGLGAPHTTDNNGSSDNIFQSGLPIFKDIKYGSGTGSSQGQYVLLNRTMAYDFKVYIEEVGSFLGVRNFGGFNWDTRTLMYQYAKPYPLFVDSDSAFNAAYSNILTVYYDSFVK